MRDNKKNEVFVLCVKEKIEQINYYAISETSEEKAIEFFKTFNKDQNPKPVKTIVTNKSGRIKKVYNTEEFKKLIKKGYH